MCGCCIRWFSSELGLATFRRHLPIESLCIFTVVVDHVIISCPLHLTLFTTAQLFVNWGGPPVGGGWRGTLSSAKLSIPLASPRSEMTESGYERCTIPVDLHKATSSCPVVSVPQTGVNPHPLLVWVSNSFTLIVSIYANWQIVNVPPESAIKI